MIIKNCDRFFASFRFNNSQKQRISITVDADLLAEVDRLTKNRSAAVEEGLRFWRKQQIEEQLRNLALLI